MSRVCSRKLVNAARAQQPFRRFEADNGCGRSQRWNCQPAVAPIQVVEGVLKLGLLAP